MCSFFFFSLQYYFVFVPFFSFLFSSFYSSLLFWKKKKKMFCLSLLVTRTVLRTKPTSNAIKWSTTRACRLFVAATTQSQTAKISTARIKLNGTAISVWWKRRKKKKNLLKICAGDAFNILSHFYFTFGFRYVLVFLHSIRLICSYCLCFTSTAVVEPLQQKIQFFSKTNWSSSAHRMIGEGIQWVFLTSLKLLFQLFGEKYFHKFILNWAPSNRRTCLCIISRFFPLYFMCVCVRLFSFFLSYINSELFRIHQVMNDTKSIYASMKFKWRQMDRIFFILLFDHMQSSHS